MRKSMISFWIPAIHRCLQMAPGGNGVRFLKLVSGRYKFTRDAILAVREHW